MAQIPCIISCKLIKSEDTEVENSGITSYELQIEHNGTESDLPLKLFETYEAKIQDYEEKLKEKQELEDSLRKELEELRITKEKELKKQDEEKNECERDLKQELDQSKDDLLQQKKQTEEQKFELEGEFNKKLEKIKVKTDVVNVGMDQLFKTNLSDVESEKSTLIQQNQDATVSVDEGSEDTLNEYGEFMESELLCSICSELFVEAATLNCSHTFCKYCIMKWKEKQQGCPICRARIRSVCRSVVLDSLVNKLEQNLAEEIKSKRTTLLQTRKELASASDSLPFIDCYGRSEIIHTIFGTYIEAADRTRRYITDGDTDSESHSDSDTIGIALARAGSLPDARPRNAAAVWAPVPLPYVPSPPTSSYPYYYFWY